MPVAQYLTINIDNVQFTSFIFYSMVTQRYFTPTYLLCHVSKGQVVEDEEYFVLYRLRRYHHVLLVILSC